MTDLYLSRVKLDPMKRKTQIALVSPNKFHGAIEEAFQKKQERNLWRIDNLNGKIYLLLLSAEIPDMTNFIQQFSFSDEIVETKEYDALLNRIQNETKWNFRLVANPTRSLKDGDGRGKIVAHVSEKYQMDWLEKKAVQNGFKIFNEETKVVNTEWKIFQKRVENRNVKIKQATFEGILIVTDSDLFKKALINGIGREKAYGMGLLTLIKI